MTPLPTFQSLLLIFLVIEMAEGSSTELRRLNTMLSVVTSKLEAMQLEMKLLQEEVMELRDELHQAKKHSDGLIGKENGNKMNDSGENKCCYETSAYLKDLIMISSKSKELAKGFRQEKQLRQDFEMKTVTRFFAMNDIIFNMNRTCQSCSFRTEKDSSIEKEINSTLHRLIADVEEIKARDKTSKLKTITESSKPATGSTSETSLCSRTVTDGTLIKGSIRVGTRVVRGRDWMWWTQDGVPPTAGTVRDVKSSQGWVLVRWDSGNTYNYRMGYDNKFDLYICE